MYVTSDEVIKWLGGSAAAVQYTTETGAVVDTDLIDDCIARVEGDVVAALRKRTAATITQADYPQTWALVAGKVLAMTVYRIACRRPPAPAEWKGANDLAVAWLEKLAKGEVSLPDAGLNEPSLEYGGEDQNAAAYR